MFVKNTVTKIFFSPKHAKNANQDALRITANSVILIKMKIALITTTGFKLWREELRDKRFYLFFFLICSYSPKVNLFIPVGCINLYYYRYTLILHVFST